MDRILMVCPNSGVVLDEFDSVEDVSYSKIVRRKTMDALMGRLRTSRGFCWVWESEFDEEWKATHLEAVKQNFKAKPRAVRQNFRSKRAQIIATREGERKIFTKLGECARMLGVTTEYVSMKLRGDGHIKGWTVSVDE